MFFTIGWSVFYFVQLYSKRVSCAVPLRIVTMKPIGALTPSRPPIVNIIPDQEPLIQGRRQQTPHPVAKRKAYDSDDDDDEYYSDEFPNSRNYTGYYYHKDYYKYYKSYYVENDGEGFQFKHPRYPYGHTVFAEALLMKQAPFAFKEIFFPSQLNVRLSSILVGEYYTQTVPVELVAAPIGRQRAPTTPDTPKKTTTLKPQTKHQNRRMNYPDERPNNKNFQSVLSYYAYNEDRKEPKVKTKIQNADKNFQSVLSYYAYNEDANERAKYSAYEKKRRSSNKRTKPSKFRRLLERLRNNPNLDQAAPLQKLEPSPVTPPGNLEFTMENPYSKYPGILGNPQDGPPMYHHDFTEATTVVTESASARLLRKVSEAGSNEARIEKPRPFDLYMPGAAEMAIAPVLSYFKGLIGG